MTNNAMELLPIGSVIKLRGAKKCLMIYGIYQTSLTTNKTYDYIGVIWPMGNMGDKTQVLFNHEEVGEVVFTGFDNEERQRFMTKLKEYYEKNQ